VVVLEAFKLVTPVPTGIGTSVVGLRAELAPLERLDATEDAADEAAEDAEESIEEAIEDDAEEASLLSELATEETADVPGETVVAPDVDGAAVGAAVVEAAALALEDVHCAVMSAGYLKLHGAAWQAAIAAVHATEHGVRSVLMLGQLSQLVWATAEEARPKVKARSVLFMIAVSGAIDVQKGLRTAYSARKRDANYAV
jgi:hypothetical protein